MGYANPTPPAPAADARPMVTGGGLIKFDRPAEGRRAGATVKPVLDVGRFMVARSVKDPEFVVEGITPKHRTEFVREIDGRLCYVNFTQIFRGRHRTDGRAAVAEIDAALVKALNFGRQSAGAEFGPVYRLTAGLSFLEEFVGAPIDPALCRLAVLRPTRLHYVEPYIPPDRDVEKARELGLEVAKEPGYWEAICEVGLDVGRR